MTEMSDLGDESRELLRAGRDVFRPSTGDRARVTSALGARLGAEVVAPAAAGSSLGLKGWTLRQALLTSTVVGVAGVAAYVLLSDAREKPVEPPPQVVAGAPSLPPPPPEVVAAESASPDTAREAATEPERRQVPASPRNSLSEEVAILAKATGALRAGRAAEALELLDEHGRRFPNGALAQERAGARIQALCALGRRSEAEAQLLRLARAAPRSPHVARARAACPLPDGERKSH
jgi:type IV secretory pathway VirB10-like protein